MRLLDVIVRFTGSFVINTILKMVKPTSLSRVNTVVWSVGAVFVSFAVTNLLSESIQKEVKKFISEFKEIKKEIED